MRFLCLVIDPPYSFNDKLNMSDVPRSADANYKTLSLLDIKNLKVKDLAEEAALLALWVPSSMLQNGLDIMKEYGFTQKQTYIWVKSKVSPFDELKDSFNLFYKKELKNTSLSIKDIVLKSQHLKNLTSKSLEILNSVMSFGMGRLFRQCHELALIGTNNNKIYNALSNKSQRSVSLAPNLKHSAKPENLQNSLDLMFSSNKIEIFARRQRKGWVCIGNESPMTLGEDISISIDKLLNLSGINELKLIKLINEYEPSKSEELYNFWKNI